jgi:phage terminase large subunit GpA-like protein
MKNFNPEPLPPFFDPRALLPKLAESFRPTERISVTDAAEKYMKVYVDGGWKEFSRDVTPYMVEPSDAMTSRLYKTTCFAGPSQSGKTLMLLAGCAYVIRCDPGRVALFQMTRDAAKDFEVNKFSPMIRNSPELASRKGTGRGSDTIYEKRFLGGTQLTLNWPTIAQLSSASIRNLLMTDFDHMPDSVDGEGDPHTLARARIRSFRSRGMVAIESSPGAPITDETWRAKGPHDCPPVKYGVLSIYPHGTRGRWHWPCPHCGDDFEPHFDRLHYPESADPAEAGEAAQMMCPHCGALFSHELKRELNNAGYWLHEAKDGRSVRFDDPDIRQTDVASWWLNGAAAAFSTWAELVADMMNAKAALKTTGDEQKLISVMNTGLGQPYRPINTGDETELTVEFLRDKAGLTDQPRGVAPKWARYVVIQADTQQTRWDVMAVAFGEGGRHQIIDRFDIATPPETAEDHDRRTVRPFERAEDWDALTVLENKLYPVEGTKFGLLPFRIGVDMQGGLNTTANAYAFYRGRRKAGAVRRWYLTRGSGGRHTDRVWLKAPESKSNTAAGKRRKVAKDIEILNVATDRLKDATVASLLLADDVQNMCWIGNWQSDAHLVEFTAERKSLKGNWEKKPGMVRNESLDLLSGCRAIHIHERGEKINWSSPQDWAQELETNFYSRNVTAPDGSGEDAAPENAAKPKARKRRRYKMRTR